jgi:hypothetical protein
MSTQNTNLPATQDDNYDPFAAYGDAAGKGSVRFLRYEKGSYYWGKDDEEVAVGTRFVANMSELQIGWQRWGIDPEKNDGKRRPLEKRVVPLVSGKAVAKREDLGFTDEALWERDKNGKAQDPWQRVNVLPLADPETGEQYEFSTSSAGGIGAVGKLCKAYAQKRVMNPGKVPVIALNSGDYKHDVYGKVFHPILDLVGFVADPGADDTAAQQPALSGPAAAPSQGSVLF